MTRAGERTALTPIGYSTCSGLESGAVSLARLLGFHLAASEAGRRRHIKLAHVFLLSLGNFLAGRTGRHRGGYRSCRDGQTSSCIMSVGVSRRSTVVARSCEAKTTAGRPSRLYELAMEYP